MWFTPRETCDENELSCKGKIKFKNNYRVKYCNGLNVSSQNQYAEALVPDVMVFGDRAFGR